MSLWLAWTGYCTGVEGDYTPSQCTIARRGCSQWAAWGAYQHGLRITWGWRVIHQPPVYRLTTVPLFTAPRGLTVPFWLKLRDKLENNGEKFEKIEKCWEDRKKKKNERNVEKFERFERKIEKIEKFISSENFRERLRSSKKLQNNVEKSEKNLGKCLEEQKIFTVTLKSSNNLRETLKRSKKLEYCWQVRCRIRAC